METEASASHKYCNMKWSVS